MGMGREDTCHDNYNGAPVDGSAYGWFEAGSSRRFAGLRCGVRALVQTFEVRFFFPLFQLWIPSGEEFAVANRDGLIRIRRFWLLMYINRDKIV